MEELSHLQWFYFYIKILGGIYVMKFYEYIETFFQERGLTLAPVTVLNYRRELERAVPSLGDKDMAEITLND